MSACASSARRSTAGYGDPKGLGWVGRVVGRTPAPRTSTSPHTTSAFAATPRPTCWRGGAASAALRWAAGAERRLVRLGGRRRRRRRESTWPGRRLNLANILDEATDQRRSRRPRGRPTADASRPDARTARIEALAEAQADVCARRGVAVRRLLRAAGRPRAVAVRPRRRPDRRPPRAGGLRPHRLAGPAQRLERLDADLVVAPCASCTRDITCLDRTRYNATRTSRARAKGEAHDAGMVGSRHPRVLDIGDDGERVGKLERRHRRRAGRRRHPRPTPPPRGSRSRTSRACRSR